MASYLTHNDFGDFIVIGIYMNFTETIIYKSKTFYLRPIGTGVVNEYWPFCLSRSPVSLPQTDADLESRWQTVALAKTSSPGAKTSTQKRGALRAVGRAHAFKKELGET
jgi:hypothetical protein